MSYVKSTKVKLLLILSITFIILIIVIKDTTEINSTKKVQPTAEKGVIDLRNWNLKKDGVVKLDGQWEFYENQLLKPNDFNIGLQENKEYKSIPGVFGDHGYGTYRLKLLVSNTEDLYSIKIDFLQSAYKLYINNREIINVGTVGKDKKNMKPQLLPKSGFFHAAGSEVYITLQVSNFYAKYGNIDAIVIGESTKIESTDRKKLAFDLFLFGSTFIAAVYNLGLFIKRKKDKSTLYFAIVCAIVAIRTLFLGERFFIYVFPEFSYIISGKIMHWTFYLYIPFIVLFIYNFYKGILSKRIIKISNASAYLYGFLVLICPWKYYMDLIVPFEFLTTVLLVHLIYKISAVYIKDNQSDYLTVIGLFALFVTSINDILYEHSIIITGSFAPLGTLIFIIATSYVLAERQSIAFANSENMRERLDSLNHLKDDFLAIVSHELKTPLNGIVGLSESLTYSNTIRLNENEKNDLFLINTSARRLTNLVNDIMVFSRLKNDEIKLQRKVVNINKIIEIVIKFISPSINNKSISIKNLIDDNAPYVFGDEGRIEQIFYNLIGNAIKFTSQGNITISYALDDKFMEISVEDTGIGIPEDKLSKIFNLYEQVDGIGEKYGGTGLGLYISKKLIELHGGDIKAASEVNIGSKFTFTLPLYLEQLSAGSNSSEKASSVEGSKPDRRDNLVSKNVGNIAGNTIGKMYNIPRTLNCYKILIVDDEYVNQKVLEAYLQTNNYLILKASNGREALKIVEENPNLDLVILDMMMPDMLGYEVCNKIREKYSLFELPILIMTAENRLENLVLSFEYGANDYLAKPFNKFELSARVNTLLTLKHSVQEALELVNQVTLAKEQLKSLSERNKESSKKVEELIEYDKLKTEFFTNLSHELRTPLNVITSTIQLLSSLDNSRTLGDERIKYYFSIMNQNSLRLLRLVNNLIDLTKVDGGYLSLNFKNGNIVYFIEEITQSVAEYINTKGISIIFDTEIEEKIIAYDEEKIERIILNLLSNAVKFTNKKGNIFVNIYDKDDFIEISIKDTGIGIPSDKLDYVFERFAQVDRSLRRRSEGSGIGLSLVKSLVELHGGKISVKSEVDKGTEFIIELPVRTVGEEVISGAALYNEVPEQKYEKSLSIEFSDIYM